MDGQHPMEELSEARNLNKVLGFRDAREEDGEFAVDQILDPTNTTLTTVVRRRSDEDGPDQRRLQVEEDWDELLAEISPQLDSEFSKPNIPLNPEPNPISRLLLFEPAEKTVAAPPGSGAVSLAQTVVTGFLRSLRTVVTAATSLFTRLDKKPPDEKAGMTPPTYDFKTSTPAVPRRDHRKRLRNTPFTLRTFRLIARRMSIHSWISRVISRANVPTFERTVTEMPLYSSTGKSIGGEKAIVYTFRTSNEWENDMALAVTHFPRQKLTFAMLFGASKEQERNVLTRLRKAGSDTAHPMLLPGILAELERIRQMDAVDEMIDKLEEQIYQIDNQTVTTWKHSKQTQAERNKQKRKAWLDATFLRSLLEASSRLLCSMRTHLDEFPALVDHPPTRSCRHTCRPAPGFLNHSAYKGPQPNAPQSLFGIPSQKWPVHDYTSSSQGSEYVMGSDTLIASEPENMYDAEAKYQDFLNQSAMRMKDRLVAIISEYGDKIRACTMEVDGMAMATQWSQGETNMEIATATGEDSSQMRSIAVVTMVFLPGTFFASMFSMTFFNWSPDAGGDHPAVSGSIWIYFVITVIFTALTLLLFWYFILSRQRSRRRPRQDSCPV